jgi:hypothetical protein
MAKQSKEQKETVQRVMHEFKHGELNQGGAAAKSKTRSRRSPLLCMKLSRSGPFRSRPTEVVRDGAGCAGFSDACTPRHTPLAIGGVREASRHEIA